MIIKDASDYETKIVVKLKNKVNTTTNKLARKLLKSDLFKKIEETDEQVSYEHNDGTHSEVCEIERNECECTDCNKCTCHYYFKKGFCIHIAAVCLIVKKTLNGCFIPVDFMFKYKKKKGAPKKAMNALAFE